MSLGLSGLRLLDWAIIALSFFNTLALLWLGLTVLLNAERRRWGTWAAGGGMTLGGLFYAGHSAVVGRVLGTFSGEMEFWWRITWLPVIGAPYLWYVVTADYTGVLHARRHRWWLALVTVLGCIGLGALVIAHPLPTYHEIMFRDPNHIARLRQLPRVASIYPIFSVLCTALALDALRHPQASERFMGDVARRRARPWLIASSWVMFGMSSAFGLAMVWFLQVVIQEPLAATTLLPKMMLFDLLISTLVAAAVVLTGQAIVSYEIFTGKVLPRRGLFAHWRRSLILAAGYGIVIGGMLSLPFQIDPIYHLLLATVLMTVFYALLSWRSYAEHERSMDRLRPFVASQRLYEHLLEPATPPALDAAAPLAALCEELLEARLVYLAALGPLAPLIGPGLAYPPAPVPPLVALMPELTDPYTMCVPVDPKVYGGAVWAVPLWSERGLIGVLLLGPKRDGSLYTQEAIELARSTGERLIDTQASAEMARRLMHLQRERLTESQVLDRRTRQVLHDDVLPRLHATMLQLSNGSVDQATLDSAITHMGGIHREIANLLHAMPPTAAPEVTRLGLVGALRQAVERELASAFDGVRWQIDPAGEAAVRSLPPLTAEVVFYAAREAVRNAARYGRNGTASRALHLEIIVRCRTECEIVVRDDGVGLGAAAPAASGSGQGFALHSTMLAVVGGMLTANSLPERGTEVILTLPPVIDDAGSAVQRAVAGSLHTP